MKNKFTLICLILMSGVIVNAQIFTKVITGDIVTTLSDSRSCNWVDFNNNGYQDIMITNGKSGGENNMLYLNNTDGTFTTITDDPIVSDNMPSDGATWADADNDGDMDAFVVNWYGEHNLFYINNNDTSFTQITTGIAVNDFGYSETASWGDFDNDGFVDLYITNSDSIKLNYLYRNNGDATFTKITTGDIATDANISRCANWIDYDIDGDVDMFVTNEANQHENLYINNGDNTFTKFAGDPLVMNGGKTMSSSWGDVDNDGDFDVFLANDGANNALFLNDGDGNFTKVSTDIVSTDGGNSFGTNFSDIDNDGDLDLFVTNAFWGSMWNNFLYLNNGDGTFTKNTTDVTATDLGWSYGNAFGDYDRDGDMDLMVANCYNAAQANNLYTNNGNDNGWIVFDLMGITSNVAAIGTIIKLKANINGVDVWQMREVSAQSGYCGQNMLPAHFGLGDATIVDSVIIIWPSKKVDIMLDVPINEYTHVFEGQYGTELENILNTNLSISPNPGTGIFNVVSNTKDTLHIYDSIGELIQSTPLTIGNNNIDLSTKPKGNYIFVLKSEKAAALIIKL